MKKNRRKENRNKKRPPQQISSITIADTDLQSRVESFNDQSVRISIEGVPEMQGLPELCETLGYKGEFIKQTKSNGGYSLNIISKKSTFVASMNHLKSMIDDINKRLGFMPQKVRMLIENIEEKDVKTPTNNMLYSEDVIPLKEGPNSAKLFHTEGYPGKDFSVFDALVREDYRVRKQSGGKIKMFEKGIPVDLLNRFYEEIRTFCERGDAFCEEAKGIYAQVGEHERFFRDIRKSYQDYERARIIQEYILENEREDEPRVQFFINHRTNLAMIMTGEADIVFRTSKVTCNYDYTIRFVDRALDMLEYLTDEVQEMSENIIIGNMMEIGEEFGRYVQTLQAMKHDAESLDWIALYGDSQSATSLPSPKEIPLDMRSGMLAANEKYRDAAKAKKMFEMRRRLDPLYLKSEMPVPFLDDFLVTNPGK